MARLVQPAPHTLSKCAEHPLRCRDTIRYRLQVPFLNSAPKRVLLGAVHPRGAPDLETMINDKAQV